MVASKEHSLHSIRREKILESLFVGEVLREFWRRDIYDVELLHSDIDAAGYDLVLSFQHGIRYIQLKSFASTKWRSQKVNAKISDKLGGCVIIMQVDDDLSFEKFYWFGSALGTQTYDLRVGKKAKHTRGNKDGVKAERVDTYRLNKGDCTVVDSITLIVDLLSETSG